MTHTKPRFTTVHNIPCWAAGYFVNADTSGLTEEDLKLCRDYEYGLLRDSGCRLVAPIDDTRNEFCAYPAFGLAGDTEDYTAEIVPCTRVVFRKYWHLYDERWAVVAFLPDERTIRPGKEWILTLEQGAEAPTEATMRYYADTRPCEDSDADACNKVLDELLHRGYRPRRVSRIVPRRKETTA